MRHEIFSLLIKVTFFTETTIYESTRIGWTDSFPITFVEGFVSECSHTDKSESRAKILRQNLFSQYETPEDMMEDIHDIIGIRIECRFIAEERDLRDAVSTVYRRNEDGTFLRP